MTSNSSKWTRRELLRTSVYLGALGTISPVRAEGDRERTVNYDELTDAAKRVFDKARIQGRKQEYYHSEFPAQLISNDIIRLNEEYYYLDRKYRGKAKYRIKPELADNRPHNRHREIGEISSERKVEYSGLSGPAQDIFSKARLMNGIEVEGDFPADLNFTHSYVKYRDDWYHLNFSHADVPIYTIDPTRIDDK